MAKVEFIFNSIKTVIQCSNDDTIKNIFNKYIIKTGNNSNSIYLLYDSKILTEENMKLSFNHIANNEDKQRKKMTLLEYENNLTKENKYLIKSKEIICPKCMNLQE